MVGRASHFKKWRIAHSVGNCAFANERRDLPCVPLGAARLAPHIGLIG
jgi:hypothetical protein